MPAASGIAWMAWYGLLVLVVATVFGAVDRQILVLLAEPMRQSLQLSDTKLGLLQGAGITLFAGVAAVPVGWLADRHGRRLLLAVCVLVWTAATAACGLAHDFAGLFAAAIGLGIGEAGLGPIVYALIPEIVPERRRVLANGLYALAAILGAGLGIALSGELVQGLDGWRHLLPLAWRELESWRLAFLLVAVPGPLMALLILLIRLDPGRAAAKASALATPLTLGGYMRAHPRTMLGIFGGNGLAALGLAANANWMPVIASRSFGATAAQIGQGIGAAYMVGTVAGALLGGAGVRWLRPRMGVATPIRVIVIGLLGAALGSLWLPFAVSAAQLYGVFGVQVAALIAGSVLAPTLVQDMTPPALRSRVIAVGSVVIVALSSSSPVLVGLLSDALKASPHGLLMAVAGVGAVSLALGALLTRTAETSFVRTVHAFNPALAVAPGAP